MLISLNFWFNLGNVHYAPITSSRRRRERSEISVGEKMDVFIPTYFPRNGWRSFPGRINDPISKHHAEDTSPDCSCCNLTGNSPSPSRDMMELSLFCHQRSWKMKLPMPKIFRGSRRRPILNCRSIGLNISPAFIHLKINAVRVGNALLEETEGKQ